MITFLIGGLLILWILKMVLINLTSKGMEEEIHTDPEAQL